MTPNWRSGIGDERRECPSGGEVVRRAAARPYWVNVDSQGVPVPAALAHRGFARLGGVMGGIDGGAKGGLVGGVDTGLENSLTAFGAAVDLGFTYVETDAHGTRDGVAVALHDATLDRTTDGRGRVEDLRWEEVRRARIGGTEPVPALDDVLGTWPSLRVNIDIKGDSGIEPVTKAIERCGAHDRVCITSFSSARRRAAVKLLSSPAATSAGTVEVAGFLAGVRLGSRRLVAAALKDVDAVQVPVSHGPLTVVDVRSIAAAHWAGKYVHVWTINDRPAMERLLDLGVDGIVTDRADVLKDVLQERGMWV